MDEPIPENRARTPLAKCERHGLHYDPAKITGCVICRREAQGQAGVPAPAAASAANSAASGARHSPAGPLLVAALLCLGAGFALYRLHGEVAKLAGTPAEMPALGRRQQMRQMEKALREMSERNPAALTSEIEGGPPSPGPGIP